MRRIETSLWAECKEKENDATQSCMEEISLSPSAETIVHEMHRDRPLQDQLRSEEKDRTLSVEQPALRVPALQSPLNE